MLEGKDSMGNTSTAGKKSAHFITGHVQLGEHHNAISYIEDGIENIYSKYKFTIYKE